MRTDMKKIKKQFKAVTGQHIGLSSSSPTVLNLLPLFSLTTTRKNRRTK